MVQILLDNAGFPIHLRLHFEPSKRPQHHETLVQRHHALGIFPRKSRRRTIFLVDLGFVTSEECHCLHDAHGRYSHHLRRSRTRLQRRRRAVRPRSHLAEWIQYRQRTVRVCEAGEPNSQLRNSQGQLMGDVYGCGDPAEYPDSAVEEGACWVADRWRFH